MYLSKVLIDWGYSRNPYEWHRALWKLFPDTPPEPRQSAEQNRQGFLFCIDRMQAGHGAVVLLQSNKPPLELNEGVRLLSATKSFEPVLSDGDVLRFRLTANPVKTIRDVEDGTKKRVPLIEPEHQVDWLKRQLALAADLLDVVPSPNPPLLFYKKGSTQGKIVTVTFDGVLRIKNVQAFQNIHQNGLGHAKAFGCGLLLIKRA